VLEDGRYRVGRFYRQDLFRRVAVQVFYLEAAKGMRETIMVGQVSASRVSKASLRARQRSLLRGEERSGQERAHKDEGRSFLRRCQ
jgi:hypothetical protein